MYFKNQKFLVAGMSKSGIAGAEFLLSRGAAVYMYDDVADGAVLAAMEKLNARGALAVRTEDLPNAAADCDVLVLSPGIPIDHELPVAFRKAGKRIIGESELGCMYLRAALVAVTGTNGKTTTVTMIDEILRAAGINSTACGNIGLPLSACVDGMGYDDVAVMEVSSFQLETLSSIRPHVAVITNITEDHLNRHYSMENYIFLKSKILRNMRESEYAVLNFDDENVRALAKDARCKMRWFSLRERAEGAYLFDGGLYFENEKIMDAADLSLKGEHNLKNALAALCAAKLMGVESGVIAKALSSMRGVRHPTPRARTSTQPSTQSAVCRRTPCSCSAGGTRGTTTTPSFGKSRTAAWCTPCCTGKTASNCSTRRRAVTKRASRCARGSASR